MTRTVKEWYFGEEDKEQIKSFSKQISTIFKVEGYNPQCDMFEDYFNLEEFEFRSVFLEDRPLWETVKNIEPFLKVHFAQKNPHNL